MTVYLKGEVAWEFILISFAVMEIRLPIGEEQPVLWQASFTNLPLAVLCSYKIKPHGSKSLGLPLTHLAFSNFWVLPLNTTLH